MICKVSQQGRWKKAATPTLDVECKDFLYLSFGLPANAPKTVFSTVQMLAFPKKTTDLFAFSYQLPPSVMPSQEVPNGWDLYNPVLFHERMGIGSAFPNSGWVLSDINADFSLCDTYPARLAFPAGVSNETLQKAASFRSRARLPTLSYLHRNGASITRCSQPNVGLIGGSSAADQSLLKAILDSNPNKEALTLRLIDARPKLNAIVNQAMGKGSERVTHYPFDCTMEFANIDNIHVMRQSLGKLSEAVSLSLQPGDDVMGWLGALGSSGWLTHVWRVLVASLKVARYVAVELNCVCLHW